MTINNVGFDHCHDADFFIDRPDGSGDYLLLLVRTPAVFEIDGKEINTPEGSVFIYPKGRPQRYRCVPFNVFENDWVHFDFDSADEEERFLAMGIPLETPLNMPLEFLSYCVKSIAYERYSENPCRSESAELFMRLMFIKIRERTMNKVSGRKSSQFELISTVRNKIYSRPYEQRNVDSTAHEVRMSRSAFQHAYKKHFGMTFIEDLVRSRVSYAKMLLSTTNMNINDISSSSGYHSYVHFARQFKEQTGYTPSEYRKKTQNVT
ncbi:MAG: AraC family transcriptional regulator [Ruminococcus sp.]|nr:AraC family transcriptional regulator [Ruminococcus sp.]